jgi:hypothetical protein
MRGVWREDLGEVEGTVENRGRECEGEVAVVVVAFGDLRETVGKREMEGDGGVAAVVVLLPVGDCGTTVVNLVKLGRRRGESGLLVVVVVVLVTGRGRSAISP